MFVEGEHELGYSERLELGRGMLLIDHLLKVKISNGLKYGECKSESNKISCMCVCMSEREREREGSNTP